MRKPPQVRSAKLTDRLICGCIYHFRFHYLLQAVNNLLAHDERFKNTADLTTYTLCRLDEETGMHALACLERRCPDCSTEKLKTVNWYSWC